MCGFGTSTLLGFGLFKCHKQHDAMQQLKETSHYLYVVMDLCRGGELFEMINEAGRISLSTASLCVAVSCCVYAGHTAQMDRLSESDTAVIAKQLLGHLSCNREFTFWLA